MMRSTTTMVTVAFGAAMIVVTGAGPAPAAADTGFQPVDAVVTAEPSGDQVLFTDLDVTREDGFDRVVWEFAGEGLPGYRVNYTDDPRRDGSGFAVDLLGDVTMSVAISGVLLPTEAPEGVEPYDGPRTIEATGTDVVEEVLAGSWFEGYQDAHLGLDRQVPFRVSALADPPRLVVEVQHAEGAPRVPVQVFYGVEGSDDCSAVTGYDRSLSQGSDPVRGAFDQLVLGPTRVEREAGAVSFFTGEDTPGVVLGTSLTDGLLVVDFQGGLPLVIPNASASCGSEQLLAELRATAFQFDEVDRVSFTLEGDCDAFFEWLQRSCTAYDETGAEVPLDGATTPSPTTTPAQTTTPVVPTAVPSGAGPMPWRPDPVLVVLSMALAGLLVTALVGLVVRRARH
ncbi:MAG: GerMN domain-containing protein [Kineosporiaceae bacterium]